MAGNSQTAAPPSKQYVDYDEYVDFQLEKARNHIKATDIFTTLTGLVTAFIGYLLVFVVCDQWLLEGGFSDWARVLLLVAVVGGLGTVLARRVILPLLRRIHPLYAARMIEQADPGLKSNLLNFVDLRDGTVSAPAKGVLRAMEKRAAVELSQIDVDEAIDRRPLLRTAYALLAVVAVSALYIVLSPKDPFKSVARALAPTARIAPSTVTEISDVTPGEDTVPARTQLTIEADVRGRDVDHVEIVFTTHDRKEVNKPVEMRRIDPDLPRFRGVLNGENGRGLLQSLTYAIVAGDARTQDFQIHVIQPPSARVDEVSYTFPPYMELEKRTTAGGGIDGWEGALVTVSATANLPVKSATLVMTDSDDSHAAGEEVSMEVADGTRLTARWTLEFRKDGTCARFYHIQVKTAKGDVDPDPMVHPLRIRADQRPEVALLHPTGDLVGDQARAPNAVIPLLIQAADPDFGLRSITLKVERDGVVVSNPALFEDRQPLGQTFRGTYEWNLADQKWTPGETVQFWIEVKDTRSPKPNRGVTPRLNLQIADKPKSADQIRRDLASEKEQLQDHIARADDPTNQGRSETGDAIDSDDDVTSDESRKPGDATERSRPPEPPADMSDADARRDAASDRDPGAAADDKDNAVQRRPVGNENERALQKLLQREQERKQQANSDRDESSANDDQSADGGTGEKPSEQPRQGADSPNRGKLADDKTRTGGKESSPPDPEKKNEPDEDARPAKSASEPKNNDDKSQPADASKSNKTRGKQDARKNATDPDRPADAAEPEKSADERQAPENKPGDRNKAQGGKPDKTRPDQKKSDKTRPDASRIGDRDSDDESEERSSDQPNSEKDPPDQTKPAAKTGDKKNDANQGPNAPPPTDDRQQGDPPANDDAADSGDKPNDKPKTPSQKPEAKGPQQGGEPNSDGSTGEDRKGSDDADSPSGTPAEPMPEDDPAGEAAGDSSKPQSTTDDRGKKPATQDQASEEAQGERRPTDDDAEARKEQGTGDEEGEATGSDKPDPDAARAKKNQQRKPGSKPGATQKSSRSPDAKSRDEQRDPQEGTSSATDDAEQTERAADGKDKTEQPGKIDDPPSEKSEKNPKGETEKRPGQPPDLGNQPKKGNGRQAQQKSEQPQGGEEGASGASDQGKKGANKEGAGDKSGQAGDAEPGDGETGSSGDKSGKGSKTKPGTKGSKTGSEGADSGEEGGDSSGKPQADSSKSSGKAASGKQASQGGAASEGGETGDSAGQASSSSPSSTAGAGAAGPPGGTGTGVGDDPGEVPGEPQERSGSQSQDSAVNDEEANLRYAREASNLLLRRLKKQLERGEVDQELLDEMGWKDRDDVNRFVEFLESSLKEQAGDDSPEATAKRLQFEELLKGMRLANETEHRQGGDKPERHVGPALKKGRPVPAEYREQYEAYTKSLNSGKTSAADKKAEPRKAAPKKK